MKRRKIDESKLTPKQRQARAKMLKKKAKYRAIYMSKIYAAKEKVFNMIKSNPNKISKTTEEKIKAMLPPWQLSCTIKAAKRAKQLAE